MSENLKLWDRFADIDPKFTKPITGRPYRGTSPNPQYVIRCMTDMFGPVGKGFGWRVVAEEFRPLGGKTLHWCRIEFWHTERANTFESYGQTLAVYKAGSGAEIVDEDAPKKSLTDAIIKAASHIGIAANIFLGRWDDQKYVAEVSAEYREKEKGDQPAASGKDARKPDEPVQTAARALGNAWRDAVEDSLPTNATPEQKAQAYAAAIAEDFRSKSGMTALDNAWQRHAKMIGKFEERFPDLHEIVVDAYELAKLDIADKKGGN